MCLGYNKRWTNKKLSAVFSLAKKLSQRREAIQRAVDGWQWCLLPIIISKNQLLRYHLLLWQLGVQSMAWPACTVWNFIYDYAVVKMYSTCTCSYAYLCVYVCIFVCVYLCDLHFMCVCRHVSRISKGGFQLCTWIEIRVGGVRGGGGGGAGQHRNLYAQ